MIGLNEQLDLFKLTGEHLKKPVECMVVGGSAMLFYGFKSATKDIDAIFHSDEDRKIFSNALKDIGFSAKQTTEQKSNKHLPIVFERGNAILDLFSKGIFHFVLSPGIKERLREKHEFSGLITWVISPEDIVLLKSVTDRKGDRIDAKEMIEKLNINWDTIIEEATWQTKNGNKAFTVYLFDFLEDLAEDFEVDIPKPVIRKIRKISEKEMRGVLEKGNINE